MEEIMEMIDKFSKDRDWDKFHTPSNIAKSISIEAGELLECFQWNDENFDEQNVKEELADVMNYCFQMCIALGTNPKKIIIDKIEKNAKKYPVEKCKGVDTKYDKL